MRGAKSVSVPEEYREYRAVMSGMCAAEPYDDMSARKTDLWFAFRALEDEAERKAIEKARKG